MSTLDDIADVAEHERAYAENQAALKRFSSLERVLNVPVAPVFKPLMKPRRFKGAKGGRGSGKSHFFAEQLVKKCCAQPGLRWVCIREIQKSLATSSKLLIMDKIRKHNLQDLFKETKEGIATPGDGMILFQGMQSHTADSIKSLEGFHGLWAEEAHTLSQYSFGILRPTIRAPGSEQWYSWNPFSPLDPVDRFFSEHPPNSILVKANYDRNPWFPANLREEMEYDKRRDPDRYNHVWLGEYQAHSEARVFRNWKVEEFDEPPADTRFFYGADWGYAIDPTVLVRCFFEGRTLYVDYEAYKIGCEIDHTPALFDKVPGARDWPITGDSSRPDTISYMSRNGFLIRESVKGQGSVEDGIEFLKSFDIVVHPRCRHTADELSLYSWKVDKKTEEVLPILADKDNHVIDALRYAVEGERRGGVSMVDYL